MRRRNEWHAHANSSKTNSGDKDDDHDLETATQYIMAHGKIPPRPSHLKGGAIGKWYAKMSRLRNSLIPKTENTRASKRKSRPLGDVALSKARTTEIKALLKGLPDKMDSSLDAYGRIRDSKFKKEFLQNITGKLEDRMEDMAEEEQNASLDEILFNEFQGKQKNDKYLQMLKRRNVLPSNSMRSEILELVEFHQVILISGETGCGKTTQVPQFLLDHFIENKKGSLCKIVCTQPRRISAISVAERVAQERAESLGLSTGYQIRLEKVCPRDKGSITFCTTGVILRQMQGDPCLSEYTHIIIDEIHERDIQTDFLITLLKQVMTKRSDLRVILMSATLNAESFSQYFDNCPHLNIPGFTYPVEEYFLEDVLLRTGFVFEESRWNRKNASSDFGSLIGPHISKLKQEKKYNQEVYNQLKNPNSEVLQMMLIYELLVDICNKEKDQGAVLIFVPGFAEISELHKVIETSGQFPRQKYLVIPLHSQMATVHQREVFNKPPKGVRKIIISTNIAETSITIDDIVFVIDCGKIKVKSYDKVTNTETLETKWVSKANASQRKGRAGRVQSGVCFHTISKARYESLDTHIMPEILRIRLENVILTAKILQLGKIEEFFSKLMDSPDPNVVSTSLELLKRLEALDQNEHLTPLGYHLAKLPLNPQIGKMLLFGVFFNCLEPVLNIAVILDYRDPYNLPLGKEKIADRKRRELAGDCQSDHLFMDKLIKIFEELKPHEKKKFCWEYFLNSTTMTQLMKLKKDFMENLYHLSFVPSLKPNCEECNCNSKNFDLVRAVVCAGLYPNLALSKRCGRYIHLKLTNGKKADLHPKSILSGEHINKPMLVYHKLVKSAKIYLHDATPVDTFHVIFFGDNFQQIKEDGQNFITINSLKFRCHHKTSNVIKALKDKLNNFLGYQISHPNTVDLRKENDETKLFRTIIDILTGEEMQDCELDIDAYQVPVEASTSSIIE